MADPSAPNRFTAPPPAGPGGHPARVPSPPSEPARPHPNPSAITPNGLDNGKIPERSEPD